MDSSDKPSLGLISLASLLHAFFFTSADTQKPEKQVVVSNTNMGTLNWTFEAGQPTAEGLKHLARPLSVQNFAVWHIFNQFADFVVM